MNSHLGDTGWMDYAACASADEYSFFSNAHPDTLVNNPAIDTLTITLFCNNCTVRARCDQYATAAGIVHGVWGGITEEERRDRDARQKIRGLIPTHRKATA